MAEPMHVIKRQNQALAARGSSQRNQYLTFTLGGETYAMEIQFIREVIQYGGLTVVPLMPDFLRGVINLRGAVVPVIDLSMRFQRSPTEPTRHTCIVILEVGRENRMATLGIMVDNVSEVLEILGEDIEPAPSFGSSLRSNFIQGMGKVGSQFVIILDVNHVVSTDELATLTTGQEGLPRAETPLP